MSGLHQGAWLLLEAPLPIEASALVLSNEKQQRRLERPPIIPSLRGQLWMYCANGRERRLVKNLAAFTVGSFQQNCDASRNSPGEECYSPSCHLNGLRVSLEPAMKSVYLYPLLLMIPDSMAVLPVPSAGEEARSCHPDGLQ